MLGLIHSSAGPSFQRGNVDGSPLESPSSGFFSTSTTAEGDPVTLRSNSFEIQILSSTHTARLRVGPVRKTDAHKSCFDSWHPLDVVAVIVLEVSSAVSLNRTTAPRFYRGLNGSDQQSVPLNSSINSAAFRIQMLDDGLRCVVRGRCGRTKRTRG